MGLRDVMGLLWFVIGCPKPGFLPCMPQLFIFFRIIMSWYRMMLKHHDQTSFDANSVCSVIHSLKDLCMLGPKVEGGS